MRIALILLLLLSSPLVFAERSITTVAVNYAAPEQLVSVIKPYLSDGSSVSVYQNQLILNVTPEELTKTRELLRQLDVAGRQLLVSLRTGSLGSEASRNVQVEGTVRSGNTVITNKPGHLEGDSNVTVRAQDYQSDASGDGNQAVRVTEGKAAYIATGMSAPLQSYSTGPGGQRYIQQDYVNASSGFYATTWVNNGTVRISIDQSNNQFKGRRIATRQLQSEVRGALGEWLPLGVINTSEVSQGSDIGARRESSQSSSTELYIKVESVDQ